MNFAIAQQFDKLANYMNYPLTIHLYMIYLISTGVYDLSCIQFICPPSEPNFYGMISVTLARGSAAVAGGWLIRGGETFWRGGVCESRAGTTVVREGDWSGGGGHCFDSSKNRYTTVLPSLYTKFSCLWFWNGHYKFEFVLKMEEEEVTVVCLHSSRGIWG